MSYEEEIRVVEQYLAVIDEYSCTDEQDFQRICVQVIAYAILALAEASWGVKP